MSDVPSKRCSKCGEDRPVTPEHWYFAYGRPRAQCRPCLQAAAAARARGEKPAASAAPPIPGVERLDIGNSPQLTRNREGLVRKLIGYANDEKSKHHEWAFKILAPHLFPKPGAPRAGPAVPQKQRGVTINVQATGRTQAPAAVPAEFPDVDPLS